MLNDPNQPVPIDSKNLRGRLIAAINWKLKDLLEKAEAARTKEQARFLLGRLSAFNEVKYVEKFIEACEKEINKAINDDEEF